MVNKYSPYPGDVIDAKLEPGEYVVNRNAVKAIGKKNLDRLNDEVAPRFQVGGQAQNFGPFKSQGHYRENQEMNASMNQKRKAYFDAQNMQANQNRIQNPTQLRMADNITFIDLHAIDEIPTNPEFNTDDFNKVLGPMSQNMREYKDNYDQHQRQVMRAKKKWYQDEIPPTPAEIAQMARVEGSLKQSKQKDAFYQQEMAVRSQSEKRSADARDAQQRHSSSQIADNMRSFQRQSEMMELGSGPKAPINPNTGERFMTVDEGDEWDASNKRQLAGVRDNALQGAQAKQKRAMAIQELKRGMHQSKMESKIGPDELRMANDEWPPSKVEQREVPERGKMGLLGRIKLAASASKYDSHKGARLRKAESAPLTKKEEILKKADKVVDKVADKKYTGPMDWEATEEEILDYEAPKVASKKKPMTKDEVDDFWEKSGGNEPVEWEEWKGYNGDVTTAAKTLASDVPGIKPGQYPQKRIDEYKESGRINREERAKDNEAYSKRWRPVQGPNQQVEDRKESWEDMRREPAGSSPATQPLIGGALKNLKFDPIKENPNLAPEYSKVWDPEKGGWKETMAKNSYDKTWDNENKKWKTEWKQEGGLIRRYAMGDYVEEGKEIFDAGVDATKAGFGAVSEGAGAVVEGAGAVANRYGRNDYADARANGADKVDSALYGGFEALQQAGSDTLTAGAAGLGAVGRLAGGASNMAKAGYAGAGNMAKAGYGGAKKWLDDGGWNKGASDSYGDVWSGKEKGSIKQRAGKGMGILGNLLQDASMAQGFQGANWEGSGLGKYNAKAGKDAQKEAGKTTGLDPVSLSTMDYGEEKLNSDVEMLDDIDMTESNQEMENMFTEAYDAEDGSEFGANPIKASGAATVTNADGYGPFPQVIPSSAVVPGKRTLPGDSNVLQGQYEAINSQGAGMADKYKNGQVMFNQEGGYINGGGLSLEGFIQQSWRNMR